MPNGASSTSGGRKQWLPSSSPSPGSLTAQLRYLLQSACTHPILSGPAVDRIANSQLDEVVITNTIPLSDAARACKKIRQLSVAFLFAETIRRISDGESVTSLFSEQNNNF